MTFDIVYCAPAGDEHLSFQYRFLTSYCQFPPNIEHHTVILTDAGNEQNARDFFAILPKLRVLATGSQGKDLQRYEEYCEQSNADCAMFLGGSTYCRRGGWGMRAIGAFMNLGSGNLYGSCGHTGAGPVRPHLRSTGFWCSPAMYRQYPIKPRDQGQRYQVEHGNGCLSDWFANMGRRVLVITFSGEYDLAHANDDPNGYARGNQYNMLVGDRLTAPPYQAVP